MRIFKVGLGIVAALIFTFLFIITLASERSSYYYNKTDAISSTLESSGFLSFYYENFLPALVSDATASPLSLDVAGIPIDIDISATERQAALLQVIDRSLPREDAVTVLNESEAAVKEFIQGSETLSASPKLVSVFRNLPKEFEENAESLGIGADISRAIADSVIESDLFSAFQIFGLTIDSGSVRSVFQEEIFSEEWVNGIITGLFDAYGRYVSLETEIFGYREETAPRLVILKGFLESEIEKADARNELKVGALLGPVLESISEEAGAAGLPALNPEEIDEAIGKGGLSNWRKSIAVEVTDTFVEYISGEATPVIEIDLTEDRVVIVEVLSSQFQDELASILAETPDCASGSTEESASLQALQSGSLPTCIPSTSAFLADTIGGQLFPSLGQLVGPLAAIIPNIDIRDIIIEISRNDSAQALERLLPASFSYPWDQALDFLPEESAEDLRQQRDALVEGVSFSEDYLAENGLEGFSTFLREGATSPEGITAVYVDLVGNFVIRSWVFLGGAAIVFLLISVLTGGGNRRQRLIWLGAVLLLTPIVPLVILILATFFPAAGLNGLFSLSPEISQSMPATIKALTSAEGTRALGELFNEVFLPTIFYCAVVASTGLIVFLIALLAERGKANQAQETETSVK